jgi:hypothetical protein
MPAYIESKYSSGTAAFVPDDEPEDDDAVAGVHSNHDGGVAEKELESQGFLQNEDDLQVSGLQEELS